MGQGRDEPDRSKDRLTLNMFAPASGADSTPATPGPQTPSEAGFAEEGGGSGPNMPAGRLEFQPGQVVFDKYEVIRRIGQGGMGTVWMVRHRELGVERALKVIVSGIATDSHARARLKREARVMALFSHPNAVSVNDARMTDDAAFIEMEYVRGRPISDLLMPGVPMPLDWTVRILTQLCEVVQVAHDLGIVHRDLKPSNLMLVDDRPPGREVLKVLDFGIAKILGSDERDHDDLHTQTGQFLGTASYACPDQISQGHVDHRSDLYSVGVMLYEFLTGYRPFAGPAVLYDHLNLPPAPFRTKNPAVDVPAEVERVVLRCLAKNPDDRPQSARMLAEEFLAALPPDAATAYLPASSTGLGPPLRDEDLPPTKRLVEASQPMTRTAPATAIGRARNRAIRLALNVSIIGIGLAVAGWALWNSRGNRPLIEEPGRSGPAVIAANPGVKVTRAEPTRFPPDGYEADTAAARQADGLPRALLRRRDGARFLLIDGGTFRMGSRTRDPEAPDDERPAHLVRLASFYLQETEVTNGEVREYFREKGLARTDWPQYWREAWENLKKAQVSDQDAARYPAVGLSRQMAAEVARWVGGRLPTEAEWEFAARSRGQDRRYVWGDQPEPSDRMANLDTVGDKAPLTTDPVGSYATDRTEQGIVDLAGNVREWCLDGWARYSEASQALDNPRGAPPADGQPFVIRGGSFNTDLKPASVTYRSDREPEYYTHIDLGFRVVIEPPPDVGR